MKAFLLLVVSLSLYAENVDSLIQKAFANNPALLSLQTQIEQLDADIKNARLYKNPSLTIGVNDISLEKPSQRDIEPMQTQFISISQEITDSDKLDLNTQIQGLRKRQKVLLLEEEKNQIRKKLYIYYFSYFQLDKQIRLKKKKIQNLEKIKSYHSTHMKHNEAFQVILQSDLLIDKLHLDLMLNEEKQEQILIYFSELINGAVSILTNQNEKVFFANIEDIDKHPLISIAKLKILQATTKKKLELENLSSDYTLSAGYYNRKSFDDYVSVSVKFPLNVYGREENNLQKAQKNIIVMNSNHVGIKNILQKNYKLQLSKYNLANKSLQHLQKISTHLEKEKELITNKKTMDSLIEVLKIENKLLDNVISQTAYLLQMKKAKVELAYLTSTLQGVNNE